MMVLPASIADPLSLRTSALKFFEQWCHIKDVGYFSIAFSPELCLPKYKPFTKELSCKIYQSEGQRRRVTSKTQISNNWAQLGRRGNSGNATLYILFAL
jgi:hypothetical protein